MGQKAKLLDEVVQLLDALNFFVLFTQASFSINTYLKWCFYHE